jgi:hypothetical protein
MKHLSLDGLQCHNLEVVFHYAERYLQLRISHCNGVTYQRDFLKGQQKIVAGLKEEISKEPAKEEVAP